MGGGVFILGPNAKQVSAAPDDSITLTGQASLAAARATGSACRRCRSGATRDRGSAPASQPEVEAESQADDREPGAAEDRVAVDAIEAHLRSEIAVSLPGDEGVP